MNIEINSILFFAIERNNDFKHQNSVNPPISGTLRGKLLLEKITKRKNDEVIN